VPQAGIRNIGFHFPGLHVSQERCVCLHLQAYDNCVHTLVENPTVESILSENVLSLSSTGLKPPKKVGLLYPTVNDG
jgi:hypothetical protein